MASATKQKLDEFRASLPIGDEHTEPTREMLRVASYACNGAPDKPQAIADAVGEVALFLAMAHRGEAHRIDEKVDAAVNEHAIKCAGKTQHTTVTTTTDKTSSDNNIKGYVIAALVKNAALVIVGGFTSVVIIVLAIVYHGDIKPALESVPGLDSPVSKTARNGG